MPRHPGHGLMSTDQNHSIEAGFRPEERLRLSGVCTAPLK